MAIKDFGELHDMARASKAPRRMAVACAADAHTLEAALEAKRAGVARPLLVGQRDAVLRALEALDPAHGVPGADVRDAATPAEACALAVRLVREGEADFIMKGMVDTGVLLKEVVSKEHGLAKAEGSVMSLLSVFETPLYHKLIAPVDGGMVTYPTLEQKKAIIENTVGAFHAMGYERPKVGVLACVEKVNPKMPETLDAAALAEMNRRGEIAGCVVDGPISYDCAVSREIAEAKGYEGEVAGDADILLAPNIHAGNIMGKMLLCTCRARMAGVVMGARCPVVLNSRGATAEEKFLSILLSACI